MRLELQKHNGARCIFTGTFERYGEKPAFKGPPLKTLLLVDIRDDKGKDLCDHIWFNLTKQFAALKLTPGDLLQFHARVRRYQKGYLGHRRGVHAPLATDYKLSHPTKIQKISEERAA